MLPADSRLRRRTDFALALRRGPGHRRVARSALVLTVTSPLTVTDPASRSSRALVGFAVSRAVGGAVVRNRVRRRLRHLMAQRVAVLPSGALVVIRALPPAATASSASLGRELDGALTTVIGRLPSGDPLLPGGAAG